MIRKIYLSLFISTLLYGEEVKVLPSYQGFRGAINTPNAEVIPEGAFEFLYTNQVENLSPSSSPNFRNNKGQKNFLLNIGILPNLDLNFQYAYGFDDITNQVYLSNRVVNAKYQIPLIPKDLFQMAVGIQDIGGGNPYIGNQYAVISKEFNKFRTNLGYAKGDSEGSINGVFGSMEYQPVPWLQIAGEYDTKEWNGAIKTEFPMELGEQEINLGLMAKSSIDYNDVYFGVYANMPFHDKSLPIQRNIDQLPSKLSLASLKLSNTAYSLKDNKVYFEYENTLYTHNDIDALGMVLGVLVTTTKAKEIEVAIKKSNIIQYIVKVNREDYQEFLKDGNYRSNLLHFTNKSNQNNLQSNHSDRFKPTITLQPDFVLVDGSEYTKVMNYTLALQAEVSLRLAKGTILSGRYNIPIGISDNFKEGGIYDYRNRNKTTADIDQALLSQFVQIDLPSPWINLLQVGRFDNKLDGISFESGISDMSGKHLLLLKLAYLKDGLGEYDMDRYYGEDREERLLSYRYYLDGLNSNIKVTAGEFLYGDEGIQFGVRRYFSDISLEFDIAYTEHDYKDKNYIAKLALSIPFGGQKRFKTDYLDIEGGEIKYTKRKALVSKYSTGYAQPHHLKEIDNSFTLESYYLDKNRFYPSYIQSNYNRLRNIFLGVK